MEQQKGVMRKPNLDYSIRHKANGYPFPTRHANNILSVPWKAWYVWSRTGIGTEVCKHTLANKRWWQGRYAANAV